jgi:adenosylcobinamide-phosphate synthase
MTARRRLLGAAAGVVADQVFGEPAIQPHPVAAFGRAMGAVERRLYRDRRAPGVVHVGVGVAIAGVVGAAARSTAAATYLAVAGRALHDAGRDVSAAIAIGDLDEARRLLPALVGRDPSGLDEKEIARAAVESIAENTVDAIVAPACWAAAAGAPGVLAHRAVDTLDSMVGYRSPRYARFGWASARADDAMAWAPARLTAALVATARPSSALAVWQAVRHDAASHPSPNAGVAEAAFAAALGLRLGGTNRYGDEIELRGQLGDGRPPERQDIDRAIALSRHVTFLLAGGLALAGFTR